MRSGTRRKPPATKAPSGFVERLRTLVAVTTQARFADEAGISRSWLNELMSGESEPNLTTLVALAKVGRVSVEWLATGRPVPVGASLGGGISYGDAGLVDVGKGLGAAAEAFPYVADGRCDIDGAVGAFLAGRAAEAWELKTVALDLAGYLPGDILVVSSSTKPRSLDVVVARSEVGGGDEAQAIWRVYAPPVCIPASSDRSILPTPLDELVVTGVVIATFRPRS